MKSYYVIEAATFDDPSGARPDGMPRFGRIGRYERLETARDFLRNLSIDIDDENRRFATFYRIVERREYEPRELFTASDKQLYIAETVDGFPLVLDLERSKHVLDGKGEWIDFEAAAQLMDDEVRERVHSCMAPCSPQDFFDEYAYMHREKFGEDFAPYAGEAW